MKKILLAATAFLATTTLLAQSDRYQKAMESRVAAVDTTRSVDGLQELANSFERIADAEKTQWLPYYYGALTQVNSGYFLNNGKTGVEASRTDMIADKAETLLEKAEALSKENSEIYVVKKMIATLRMMADPMNRYMQYGPKAAEALAKAKQLDPTNPRVYLLEGQDKFFTPEQFGGSKAEAKKMFEEAMNRFNSFKPANNLAPVWGKSTVAYFLSQVK